MRNVSMRNVIVTGGSRGLGLGIVRRLIAEGYCAIAVARHMNDQLASTIEHAEHSGRSTGSSTTRRWARAARWRS